MPTGPSPGRGGGNYFLNRALEAEDKVTALQERVHDLEGRLKAAMNFDPTTAVQALSWIGRAEQAEGLLRELKRYTDQRSIDRGQFPNGLLARIEAQLKSVDVLRRDMAELAERPDDSEAYWATADDAKGRRGVVKPHREGLDLQRRRPKR